MDADRAMALAGAILAGELALAAFLLVPISVLAGRVIELREQFRDKYTGEIRRRYMRVIMTTSISVAVLLLAASFTAAWFMFLSMPIASVYWVFQLSVILVMVTLTWEWVGFLRQE